MSSQDLRKQEADEVTPSMADTDNHAKDQGRPPVPVDSEADDAPKSSETAEQSWEQFEDEPETEVGVVSDPPGSAFSDDSDDSQPQSPVEPKAKMPQQAEDENDIDRWSDDYSLEAPPLRPAILLVPSDIHRSLRSEGEEPWPPTQEEEDKRYEEKARIIEVHSHGPLDAKGNRPPRPVSGHQTDEYDPVGGVHRIGGWGRNPYIKRLPTGRGRGCRADPNGWSPSKSPLNAVMESSSDEASEDSPEGSNTAAKVVTADASSPDSSEDSPGEYGEEQQAKEAEQQSSSEAGCLPASVYEDFERDVNALQHEGESSGAAVKDPTERHNSTTSATDDGQPNFSSAYELTPTLDDTPFDSYADGQPRQGYASHEPHREQSSRPQSPIDAFHSPLEPNEDYSSPEAEFDAIVAGYEAPSQRTNEDGSERPPTPPSAEILEMVTGMSLEDGWQRFKRLEQIVNSKVMLHPARALEMKRQMFLYYYGRERYRVVPPGGDDSKVKARAAAAWAAAAAHNYRYQREDARSLSEDWEYWGKQRHNEAVDAGNARDKEIERAQILEQEVDDLNQALEDTCRDLNECRGERDVAKQQVEDLEKAAGEAGTELDACIKRRDQLEGVTRQVAPLYDELQRRKKNPPKDFGTQTDPELSAGGQAASTEQTERSSGYTDAGIQTDDPAGPDADEKSDMETDHRSETDSDLFSEDAPVRPTTDRGVQTGPDRTDPVPLLRFEIDSGVRSRLIPEIVRWINEFHLRHRGDVSIGQVTAERVDTLLSGETTYDRFVSALESDGYLFRPDHLAQHIERFINENSLGRVPLAALQQTYRITRNGTAEDVAAVYDQIAQRQIHINRLQYLERRATNMEAAPMNSDPAALAELRISLDDASRQIEDRSAEARAARRETGTVQDELFAVRQGYNQATGHASTLQREIDQLRSQLSETEETLADITERQTKSPSQSSKASDKVDGERTAKLESDLKACHAHCKELEAAKDKLEKNAEHWKHEFEEMQRKYLEMVDQAIKQQAETDDLPALTDEDDKNRGKEDNEVAKLRAEVERLGAEDERLTASHAQPATAEKEAVESDNARATQANAHLPTAQQESPAPLPATHASTSTVDAADAAELKRLRAENAKLHDVNARQNALLNFAARMNMQAQSATANLATPAAVPLPITPALLSAGAPALPTGNSLLRPTQLRAPRTSADDQLPLDGASMPARWVERERRIRGTAEWRANVRRIEGLIQERGVGVRQGLR